MLSNFRVQYIQEVVLPTPSVFEENMLSTLSSFIFFNKNEIVTQLQEDEKFLTELFNQLTDEDTEESRRKELVLFLKEFFSFSTTLQPQARESFFKTLNNLGVLQAMEITLASENKVTKSASIDILRYTVDFSPSMVREYMLQQLSSTEDDTLLMNVVIGKNKFSIAKKKIILTRFFLSYRTNDLRFRPGDGWRRPADVHHQGPPGPREYVGRGQQQAREDGFPQLLLQTLHACSDRTFVGQHGQWQTGAWGLLFGAIVKPDFGTLDVLRGTSYLPH